MIKSSYISDRFFWAITFVIVLFVLWFSFPIFEYIAKTSLTLLLLVSICEWLVLYKLRNDITTTRQVTKRLSLSDIQPINYKVTNASWVRLKYEMIDEMPFQLQERALKYENEIDIGEVQGYKFDIRPVKRGIYEFGKIHLYISLPLPGLMQRKITIDVTSEIEVYPSFLQMKYYDLQVFSKVATRTGIRQVRRLGSNDEFEHIKTYTQGDTPRSINWRATSRSNEVMVNQYQDTRSQNVYCVIDMGRSMKMPFDNLSLLDHAINSSLVLSNIILKKYDRVGLVTFAEEVNDVVKADSNRNQLQKIINRLYNQRSQFKESSFERLYYSMRHQESRRSVVLLYSNFEHLDDLRRQLPYLRALNKRHLLVVIFFTNTELLATGDMTSESVDDIYLKTMAQKAIMEKELIRKELLGHHIQAIMTKPEELSTKVINKYLEIKARRMM